MNSAPKEHTGLALGAWGAVQATAAGVAVALGGVLGDVIGSLAMRGAFGPGLAAQNTGFVAVYGLEMLMLLATLLLMRTLVGNTGRQSPESEAGSLCKIVDNASA